MGSTKHVNKNHFNNIMGVASCSLKALQVSSLIFRLPV